MRVNNPDQKTDEEIIDEWRADKMLMPNDSLRLKAMLVADALKIEKPGGKNWDERKFRLARKDGQRGYWILHGARDSYEIQITLGTMTEESAKELIEQDIGPLELPGAIWYANLGYVRWTIQTKRQFIRVLYKYFEKDWALPHREQDGGLVDLLTIACIACGAEAKVKCTGCSNVYCGNKCHAKKHEPKRF